jgi:hypothetical protein
MCIAKYTKSLIVRAIQIEILGIATSIKNAYSTTMLRIRLNPIRREETKKTKRRKTSSFSSFFRGFYFHRFRAPPSGLSDSSPFNPQTQLH